MQIIPKKTLPVETHWQKELANSFNDIYSLLDYLQIDPRSLDKILLTNASQLHASIEKNQIFAIDLHNKARKLFPMRVPKPFAHLMQVGNWHDPLLQQVIPHYSEFTEKLGFISDPLQEQNTLTPGLIHKYKSRVLILVRGGCAVNCRYCFRRHFPYQDNHLNSAQSKKVIEYIKQDLTLNEVIFSGGDPLMANDTQLAQLAKQIDSIDHIKRLRIHTRLPVVIPNRINNEYLAWIANLRVKPIMVLHINHANEIGNELKQKMKNLSDAGVTLLNQSVLLKNINDSADALENLSEKLFDANILPYYLHMLDPVKGASHFDVSKLQAKELMAELIKRLPGFLVPKLVQELAGQPGKTPIDLGLEP